MSEEIPNQGRGKLARYPKAQRDELCRLIRDGAPYAAIIARCEQMRAEGLKQSGTTEPVEIPSEVNLTNFKNSQLYRQWLRQEERLESARAKVEFTKQYVNEFGGSSLIEGSLLNLQSELYELLEDFDFKTVGENLAMKPDQMPAFLNALARLSSQTLGFDKFREQVRTAREAIANTLQRAKQTGGLTPETITEIEQNLKLL